MVLRPPASASASWWQCKFSGSTPTLPNQKFWSWGSAISLLQAFGVILSFLDHCPRRARYCWSEWGPSNAGPKSPLNSLEQTGRASLEGGRVLRQSSRQSHPLQSGSVLWEILLWLGPPGGPSWKSQVRLPLGVFTHALHLVRKFSSAFGRGDSRGLLVHCLLNMTCLTCNKLYYILTGVLTLDDEKHMSM